MKRAYIPFEPATSSIQLNKLALNYRDLSMDVLRKRIKRFKPSKIAPIEKKLMILKLLSLSNMHYTQISKETGVPRRCLYEWQDKYGSVLATSEPEAKIAQEIETNLAVVSAKYMTRAYNNTDLLLEKLMDLAKTANSIRHIHAVAEALQVTIEVIKLEKRGEVPPEKGATFFQNVFNQMIQTTDHGNQD